MKHGFIKVAAATPKISVANCSNNISEIIKLHDRAHALGVKLLVFPELCVTGASAGDLFFSQTLQKSAQSALKDFLLKTNSSDTISIIGFPLIVNDKIYNSAVICHKGKLLGVVPKENLNNHESRYFSRFAGETKEINLCGMKTTFGANQTFTFSDMPEFSFCVEIGNDLCAKIPPSTYHTENGATIVANPCADAEIVESDNYRKMLVTSQSSRNCCGYILSSAGDGESTTDAVYGGHRIIAECGDIISEALPFASDELLVSEIDVMRICADRYRFPSSVNTEKKYCTTYFDTEITETKITRKIDAYPFIPENKDQRNIRAEKILTIQAKALAQRIVKAYAKKCVIGISGGLDSCLALLVTAEAMKILNRPVSDIVAVTMPCFGTTKRTRSNAEILCSELGCDLRCINIGNAVKQHFSDIGHNENDHNVVYENAQARERTQVIMDIANMENGFVVGTGDLSELALGWATYNGDHMSMYGVNAGVPKTLVRCLVKYYAEKSNANGQALLSSTLLDIVDTPVSPELLPADESGNIAQITEDLVGPYDIHDFYIYNTLRFGYSPDKLYRLACIAFDGQYDNETLKKWLKNFAKRFFAQQFKRSCLPDGPKIGTVGLSPRGDLKMPSDASSEEWIKIIDSL